MYFTVFYHTVYTQNAQRIRKEYAHSTQAKRRHYAGKRMENAWKRQQTTQEHVGNTQGLRDSLTQFWLIW